MPKPVANAKRPNLQPLKRCRPKDRRTRLRKSMVPGRVGVVLIGRYTSKKVVFLKQLESGLLLCACMNNGSVRRFPQKWVLATSQQIDVSKVDTKSWDDSDFKTLKSSSGSDQNEEFFNKEEAKSAVPEEFKNKTQATMKGVEAACDKVMALYLKAKFNIPKDRAAHEMVL